MPACCTPSLFASRPVVFTSKRASRIRRRAQRRGPGREGLGNKVTENSLQAMPWPHGAELYKPKDLGLGGDQHLDRAITFQHMPASMPPSPLSPQGSSHNHAMANGPDRRQHTFPPPPPRPVPSLEASGDQRPAGNLASRSSSSDTQRDEPGPLRLVPCHRGQGRALGRPTTSIQSRRIPHGHGRELWLHGPCDDDERQLHVDMPGACHAMGDWHRCSSYQQPRAVHHPGMLKTAHVGPDTHVPLVPSSGFARKLPPRDDNCPFAPGRETRLPAAVTQGVLSARARTCPGSPCSASRRACFSA